MENLNLKTTTIIMGKQGTGKTLFAKKLTGHKKNILFVSGMFDENILDIYSKKDIIVFDIEGEYKKKKLISIIVMMHTLIKRPELMFISSCLSIADFRDFRHNFTLIEISKPILN